MKIFKYYDICKYYNMDNFFQNYTNKYIFIPIYYLLDKIYVMFNIIHSMFKELDEEYEKYVKIKYSESNNF